MKKYLFGAFAVVLAVGFSSFTARETKQAGVFYKYTGPTSQTVTLREDPSNYTKVAADPRCTSSIDECAVKLATDNGTHPDFSTVSFDGSGFPVVDHTVVLANEKLHN
jgi:hypothetical protein